MRNEQGSVLVVTVGFIFIFTVIGLSTIHLAGAYNQNVEKRSMSEEAFWLADGGIEEGKHELQKMPKVLIPEADQPKQLGGGTYDVYSKADPGCVGCVDRWLVHSEGLVKGEKRTIEAIVARYDIDKVLTTRGPIKNFSSCPMGSLTIDCSLVTENTYFTFESVLNGKTEGDVKASATHVYNNPSNSNDVDPIAEVTLVNLTGNNHSLSINTDHSSGSPFFIVDTTGVTSSTTPSVTFNGSTTFNGIVWVIGEANFTGNANINGAVFVEGDSDEETKALGNATIIFDPAAINDALGHIDGVTNGTPTIVEWKEI